MEYQFIHCILKRIDQLHEQCLMNVFSQILRREATPEDFKRCVILKQDGVNDWFDVAWDGVTIGRVITDYGQHKNILDYNQPTKISVTFHPIDYDKYNNYLHLKK